MAEYVAHEPVLMREVLELLALRPGMTVVDGTAGSGAATAALLDAVSPDGRVIAMDRDPQAIDHCQRRFADHPGTVLVAKANFADMAEVLEERGVRTVNAVLLDLGVSSHQLSPGRGRGFSFQCDEPLDMRMDPTEGESAASLIGRLDEGELARVLWELGEERHSRRIARAVCAARSSGIVRTTGQLAEVVARAVPGGRGHRIHPATRTFMALRVAVNRELDALDGALAASVDVLSPGGRLAAISYHSLEDRRVKRFIRGEARGCVCPPRQPVCTCGHRPALRDLTRTPVRPSDREVWGNPRARSAKLRAAEKLHPEGTEA